MGPFKYVPNVLSLFLKSNILSLFLKFVI